MLIEFFGDQTAWKLFSKNWTNWVASLEDIEKQTLMEVDRNFSEALHAITIALNDKIAAVVTKAQQVLENLLNQTTGINSNGLIKSNLDFMTMNLMDWLGDNNK